MGWKWDLKSLNFTRMPEANNRKLQTMNDKNNYNIFPATINNLLGSSFFFHSVAIQSFFVCALSSFPFVFANVIQYFLVYHALIPEYFRTLVFFLFCNNDDFIKSQTHSKQTYKSAVTIGVVCVFQCAWCNVHVYKFTVPSFCCFML